MTIRCLALDDERYAAEIMADYIRKVPFLSLVEVTTDAMHALSLIQNGEVDLLFLDIQMPDINGVQLARLVNNKCRVIFTTAYPEYALDGYEHDVVDYLLKPVSFDRFLRAVQKVQPPAAVPLPAAPAQPDEKDYFFIKGETRNKFIKVAFNDILFVEGLKNYVSVQLSGQRHVTYLTLKEVETQLPGTKFLRVHKSFIVSLEKISMVDGNIIYIDGIK
ncbi:MAG TPA: LytTR family DNA-binding domain-containing protein, partial [Sphingobacteriaceae bacterium]